MSFLRHEEIYRSDVGTRQDREQLALSSLPVLIGLDEFPVAYSLAGCPPAEPASASPTANDSQQPTMPYNDFSANGNNPLNFVSQPKGALQILPATHRNQLFFGHAVSPHHIRCAFGADHCGASFEGNVRNIQDMVVMCVSDKDKIRPLNVRIDCRYIRRGNVTPTIRSAGVSSHGVARSSSRRRRSIDSRQIWIDQNSRRSIGDFPARRSQIFENDFVAFSRTRLVLSG